MANSFYAKGLEHYLNGDVDMLSDDIRMIATKSTYVADYEADETLADIDAGDRVAVSSTLTGISTLNGIFDATDGTFTSVSGAAFDRLVFVKWTGTDSTTLLLGAVTSYTGLPFTPSGGNIVVVFPNGSMKIFRLSTVES